LKSDRIVMHPLPDGLPASEAAKHVSAAVHREKRKKSSRKALQGIKRIIGWHANA
jgi:hypothetical protein